MPRAVVRASSPRLPQAVRTFLLCRRRKRTPLEKRVVRALLQQTPVYVPFFSLDFGPGLRTHTVKRTGFVC